MMRLRHACSAIASLALVASAHSVCSTDYRIPNPEAIPSNGCLYGACSETGTDPAMAASWRCVHDASFCRVNGETFVAAEEVLAAGRKCTCKDILHFPQLIGACLHHDSAEGVVSPMLFQDDCPAGGTAACGVSEHLNGAEVFDIGDTDHPYTACDLTCFHGHGHSHVVREDTYRQCATASFEWAVGTPSPEATFSARDIVSTLIDGVPIVIVGGEAWSLADNGEPISFRGPYTASDIDASNESLVTELRHPVPFYPDEQDGPRGPRPYDNGYLWVDGSTGIPIRMITLEGPGTVYTDAMDIGGPGKLTVGAAQSQEPAGSLSVVTKVCTPKIFSGGAEILCETDPITNEITATSVSHATEWIGNLISFSAVDGSMNWIIRPFADLTEEEAANGLELVEAGANGVTVDTAGDMYVIGGRKLQNTINSDGDIGGAALAKYSGADGSLIWQRFYTSTVHGVKGSYDEETNALFMTYEMEEGGPDELGVVCDNPANGGCSIVVRHSALDGSVEWVRYAHGIYTRPYNLGGTRPAKPADGPYIYVQFQEAGQHGPSTLDRGSAYGGCIADDGTITPEYAEALANRRVDQDACTELNLGIYFGRDDPELSIPASAANTGVHCPGSPATSCLLKFNKHNGLPVWGIPKPHSFEMQTTDDGVLLVGTDWDEPPHFDSVQVAGAAGDLAGYGTTWQSKVDTDGNGLYVQTLRSDRSYAGNIGLTQAPNGDHFITMYTGGQGLRLGPGAPGGFNLNLGSQVVECTPEDVICEGNQRTVVTKLGPETTPSCIETCGSDGQDLVVAASSCYIDGICYEAEETASGIGLPCMACDPSKSQTEWSEAPSVGVDFCSIDGVCVVSGTPLSTRVAESACQSCTPAKDSYGWTVLEGFEAIAPFPPEDCMVADPTSAPILVEPTAPVPAPTTASANDSEKELDTDTNSLEEDVDLLEGQNDEEPKIGFSAGAIAGIVIGSLIALGIIVGAAFVMGGRDATRKEDQSPEQPSPSMTIPPASDMKTEDIVA
mmetsp:Transcript_23658/g.56025  ORF Transcript_23658/g.56025 Transcript_23658/m.56025 type:complete len:1013 (+) Transcript_23658:135-3173(+)|eukprot:CAMPEP_0197189922 /NCGR_PEP_ID=MMETSP1423-20130617/20655_1 /TAXON_ID=476441 /ORGANISM="Pseudo-nitzschia heimii, Strain UNC1101" /LENGTH=1012 /DNA_ID=CAMNT_0042642181 /DNA_START=91 /DNA_END=3129 /DNA_ORIENTATION=-